MKKRILMSGAALCALFLSMTTLGAAEEEQKLESVVAAPIVKLALFKNGMASVIREIKVPSGNSFAFTEKIDPVHGSVWIDSPGFSNLIIRNAVRSFEKPNINPFADICRSYEGEKVTLSYTSGNNVNIITGTVINPVPDAKKEREWSREYGNTRNNYYYQNNYQANNNRAPSNFITLKTDGGRMVVLPVNAITMIDSASIAQTVSEERSVLVFETADKKKFNSPVLLSYLTKGITWSPFYRVVLGKDNKMKLYMATTITNELESFTNAEIKLISGYPNIRYANTVSPLAFGVTLNSFFTGMQQNQDGFMMADAMSQRAINYSYEASRGSNAVQYNVMEGSGEAEDIQYYSAGRLSMNPGETIYLPLDDAETKYERIVEWTIPDRRDYWGRLDNNYNRNNNQNINPYGDLWDALRFKNPFKTAMTTAPVEIVEGEKILGQTTSNWTNPDQANIIKITKAMTVTGKVTESEVKQPERSVVNIGGRNFMNPNVEGTVILKNYRKAEATVLVNLQFSGTLISAEGNPENTISTNGLYYSVNPRNELKWEVKLKPDEELKLNYKYSVLVYY